MKTTDSKDLAKVNQILPIMQEYFGKSMNLARIKLMAYMLHALCVVQTVSLHKLASAMLRRLSVIPICAAFSDSSPTMPWTSTWWQWWSSRCFLLRMVWFWVWTAPTGSWRVQHQYTHPRHYLQRCCLSITVQSFEQTGQFQLGRTQGYHGAVHPTFWTWLHRLPCGRPRVIGKEWIGWLNDNRIRYYIRIRQDIGVVKPPQEKESERGGSSIPLKSDRRNSTTSSFCIKGSMSILQEVESKTLTGYPNFRSWSVSIDLKME